MTPLLDAARRHDIQTIGELLARGANPHAKSEGGNNALIYLVQAPPPAGEDELEAELESLADSVENTTYRSDVDELAAMRLLLEHGIDIEATDAAGNTALDCAVVADNLPAVELLLAAGADGLRFGRYDTSPLAYALEYARTDCLRRLLDRAAVDDRLAEIAADERYWRWIDEAQEETARVLEVAIGRAGKDERRVERILREAGELEDEVPAPVELTVNANGTAVFLQGPILKLCPRCGHVFRNFFGYTGSRYGAVGNYLCPHCMTWYILHDHDCVGSPIHYKIHDDSDYVTLLTLDYTRLYRFDALPAIVERHAPGLFDDLHDRSLLSLSEVMDRLRAALGAAPEEPADRRLEGGHVPPPDVAAWLGWVERLLPRGPIEDGTSRATKGTRP